MQPKSSRDLNHSHNTPPTNRQLLSLNHQFLFFVFVFKNNKMRVLANSLRTILRPRLVQTAVARPIFKAPVIRHLSATLPRRVDDEWSVLRVQTLRLGSEAPNFRAQTTHGKIDFHKFRPPPSLALLHFLGYNS